MDKFRDKFDRVVKFRELKMSELTAIATRSAAAVLDYNLRHQHHAKFTVLDLGCCIGCKYIADLFYKPVTLERKITRDLYYLEKLTLANIVRNLNDLKQNSVVITIPQILGQSEMPRLNALTDLILDCPNNWIADMFQSLQFSDVAILKFLNENGKFEINDAVKFICHELDSLT